MKENGLLSKTKEICPVCNSKDITRIKKVRKFNYFQCLNCESIFLEKKYMKMVDEGKRIVHYDDTYWDFELYAAKLRAYGPCLARAAETFYYCRREIHAFLDIGTGPGYFLDAIAKYLPRHSHIFYGIEKFPPEESGRSEHENYLIGDISDMDLKFDAGICVEVVEHLTPTMLRGLFKDLAQVSNPQALYIFNTGLPSYVLNEDIEYLDPTKRGHVGSYSVKGINYLANQFGFTAYPIPGKTWAYCVEFQSNEDVDDMHKRLWKALPENLAKLEDPEMGSVLQILGRETAIAYQ